MAKITWFLALFVCAAPLFSQSDLKKDVPAEAFSVQLSQDNASGFLPSATGSFPLSHEWSFTFYGNFWTDPFYGTATTGGIDLWLEAGVGAATTKSEGHWTINPSLGMTNGKVLSGGKYGAIGEGIVPNIFSFYKDSRWECELYAGYYKSLRKKGLAVDYVQTWLTPGICLTKNLSFGAHFELFHLNQTATGGGAQALYQWVGGYIKFTVGERYWMRFSGGKNFISPERGGYSPEFYRLSVGIPFL